MTFAGLGVGVGLPGTASADGPVVEEFGLGDDFQLGAELPEVDFSGDVSPVELDLPEVEDTEVGPPADVPEFEEPPEPPPAAASEQIDTRPPPADEQQRPAPESDPIPVDTLPDLDRGTIEISDTRLPADLLAPAHQAQPDHQQPDSERQNAEQQTEQQPQPEQQPEPAQPEQQPESAQPEQQPEPVRFEQQPAAPHEQLVASRPGQPVTDVPALAPAAPRGAGRDVHGKTSGDLLRDIVTASGATPDDVPQRAGAAEAAPEQDRPASAAPADRAGDGATGDRLVAQKAAPPPPPEHGPYDFDGDVSVKNLPELAETAGRLAHPFGGQNIDALIRVTAADNLFNTIEATDKNNELLRYTIEGRGVLDRTIRQQNQKLTQQARENATLVDGARKAVAAYETAAQDRDTLDTVNAQRGEVQRELGRTYGETVADEEQATRQTLAEEREPVERVAFENGVLAPLAAKGVSTLPAELRVEVARKSPGELLEHAEADGPGRVGDSEPPGLRGSGRRTPPAPPNDVSALIRPGEELLEEELQPVPRPPRVPQLPTADAERTEKEARDTMFGLPAATNVPTAVRNPQLPAPPDNPPALRPWQDTQRQAWDLDRGLNALAVPGAIFRAGDFTRNTVDLNPASIIPSKVIGGGVALKNLYRAQPDLHRNLVESYQANKDSADLVRRSVQTAGETTRNSADANQAIATGAIETTKDIAVTAAENARERTETLRKETARLGEVSRGYQAEVGKVQRDRAEDRQSFRKKRPTATATLRHLYRAASASEAKDLEAVADLTPTASAQEKVRHVENVMGTKAFEDALRRDIPEGGPLSEQEQGGTSQNDILNMTPGQQQAELDRLRRLSSGD